MKKNIVLYVLLVFLIVVNGIFLFLFLNKSPRKGQNPEDFIIKELKFDKDQLNNFKQLSGEHHKKMRDLSKDIRELKDELFTKIRDTQVSDKTIDSITNLISNKEQIKDKLVFYHFRVLRAICNDKQKKRFDKIIKDGLHRGRGGIKPPRRDRERQGPPPPRH